MLAICIPDSGRVQVAQNQINQLIERKKNSLKHLVLEVHFGIHAWTRGKYFSIPHALDITI